MRKSNKFQSDDSGVSGITMLIVIIIIGLLVWEFGLPFLSESITTPSDYFRPDPSEITAKWSIVDLHTGEVIDVHTAWSNEIYYAADDNYSIVINTNAPWSIISPPYYFDIEIWKNSQILSGITEVIPYTSLWSDSFTYTIGMDFSGADDYQVYARLLDSDKIDTGLLYSSFFFLG